MLQKHEQVGVDDEGRCGVNKWLPCGEIWIGLIVGHGIVRRKIDVGADWELVPLDGLVETNGMESTEDGITWTSHAFTRRFSTSEALALWMEGQLSRRPIIAFRRRKQSQTGCWVSVNDKRPTSSEIVHMLCRDNAEVWTGHFNLQAKTPTLKTTHWMPIEPMPPAPEKTEEEKAFEKEWKSGLSMETAVMRDEAKGIWMNGWQAALVWQKGQSK